MRAPLFALVIAVLLAPSAARPADFLVQPGDPLPRFTVPTAADGEWSSGDDAPVTVVQVIAPDSPVCTAMAPASRHLWEQLRPRGARMVAIVRGADAPAALAFAQAHGLDFPLIPDPTGEKAAWFAQEGRGVPRTLIIAGDGRVAYVHEGWRTGREAEFQRIAEAVAEGRMVPSLMRRGPGGAPPGQVNLVGQKAPELHVERWITREPGELGGKYVMTEFWATWCGPCIQSMPHLQEMSETHADRLVIRSVSDEPASDISAFLRGQPYTYPLGTDTQRRTADRIGVHGIPFAYIQNPEGIVVWQGHPLMLALEEGLLDRILSGSTLSGDGSGDR